MITELQNKPLATFEALEAVAPRMLEVGPFRTLRQQALRRYRELGMPTTRQEEWKYLNLRPLGESHFIPAPKLALTAAEVEAHLTPGLDGPKLVFVNGRYCEEHSSPPSGLGITAGSLARAMEVSPELVETYLGKQTPPGDHPFAALNTALFEDGLFLHFAPDARLPDPIQVLFLTGHKQDLPGVGSFPRNLLILEDGAEAHLVETYASVGHSQDLCCSVSEAALGRGAKLEHVRVLKENTHAFHVSIGNIIQGEASALNAYSVCYGGQLTRNDLNVVLDGTNIHSRLDGVVALSGDQIADNHTRLDHALPHCDSFEVYKHIVDDQATAIFNGKIYVHQDAQKTDAKQTNQALLLSPNATMNSKPQLEIFADDVKCTHGATIGQLREEAMFYLRSRSIPESEARALLVYAFAAEVLERISNAAVRKNLERLLYEKLSKGRV